MDGKKIEDWTEVTDAVTDQSLTIVQTQLGAGKTTLAKVKEAMGTSDIAVVKVGVEPDTDWENRFTLPVNAHNVPSEKLDESGNLNIAITPVTVGAAPKDHKFTEADRQTNDYGVADSTHYGHAKPSIQTPGVQTSGDKQGNAGTPNGIYSPADHIHPSDPNKQDVITGAASSVVSSNLTSEKVVVTDANGKITESSITVSELNQLSSSSGSAGNINTRLDTIEGKIPNAATTANQLADKEFVNSSISNATANFKGSYETYAAFQEAWPSIKPDPSINDYAIVLADETEGHENATWRYKYNSSGVWVAEYKVNNTAFTAAQNNAINSGITSELVAQISTNEQNISANSNQITTVQQSIKNSEVTIKKGNTTVDSFTLNQSSNKEIELPDYYEKTETYTQSEIDAIAADKIDVNQGSANAGKVMIVGSDGDVEPTDFEALPTPEGAEKLLISAEENNELGWTQVDASSVGQVIQLSVLPTASAEYSGQIRQYIGANTSDLINGNFYRCQSVSGGYEWVKIEFGGKAEVPTMTEAQYEQLSDNDKNDHSLRCLSDRIGVDLALSEIDDTTTSAETTWSSSKISENLGTFVCESDADEDCVIESSNLGNSFVNKQTIKVLFENGHYGSSFGIALNNGSSVPIYKTSGGQVSLMSSVNMNRNVSGEGAQNWYCQEYTTLELVFLQSLNSGNGGLLIIGNPTVISTSTQSVMADGSSDYYRSGDVFESNLFIINGFITSSAKKINFSIPMPKSFLPGTTLTLNTLKANLRGISGYLNSNNSIIDLLYSGYSVTVQTFNRATNMLEITVESSTAFTNVTNNTPVSVRFSTAGLKFTVN